MLRVLPIERGTGSLDVLKAEQAVPEFRPASYRELVEREIQMAILDQIIGCAI